MKPSHPDYQQLKMEGKLPQQMPGFYKVKTTPQGKKVEQLKAPSNFQSMQKTAAPRGGAGGQTESCNCFQERDDTYQVVEMSQSDGPPLFRNDDGSSDEIQLPFEYCLYGDTYDRVFINNNGNISFSETVGTFSSEAFPNNFVMVAPFWGDVDTRGANSGVVYYKIAEHYMVVIWEEVGYYSSMDNLRNSFQVVITDGTDPIVPFGFNTGFCYGDMQWTTGSASQGQGGFGGIPATVGANRGNGIDFVQFGRFDQAGNTYDGPFNNNDGISWLDDQTFFFNTCTSGGQENVAPIPIASDICDTINLCVGQTYPFLLNFLAVEPDQSCSTFVAGGDQIGLEILGNEVGNVNIFSGVFTAQDDNIGMNEFTIICVDDGDPAASTEITAYFRVLENNFTPTILGLTALCDGESTELTVGGGIYDEYSWSPNGEATPSIDVSTAGEYSVSVIVGGCLGTSDPITIVEQPSPSPVIDGASAFCGGNLATIYTTEEYASYTWSNFATTDSIDVGAGSYTVTVLNDVGCEGTSAPFTVEELSEITPVIEGNTFICFDVPTQLSTVDSYASYEWSTTDTTSEVIVSDGTYTVFVVDEFGCSGTSEPFTVVQNTPQAEIIDSVAFCRGDTISLTAGGNFVSYEWRDVDFNLLGEGQTLEIWQGDTLNLTITDEDGCFLTQQFIIPATELPTASYTFNPEETVILLPDAIIQYNDNASATDGDPIASWNYLFEPQDGTWIPGEDDFFTSEQNPLVTYPDTGLYFITQTVISELGCLDTVKTSIYVIDNPYVPNAISPNGDGFNDFLKIPFLNGYPQNLVVIFNRWGKKVYEATDYKNDWDGENLPSGTYFYVVTAPTLNQELKGSITLFKD